MTNKIIHFRGLVLLCAMIGMLSQVHGQVRDTVDFANDSALIMPKALPPIKIHSPHKASFYAAILPGLGQAYNKKYWKIPLLYAGIGGMAYGIQFNSKQYKNYRSAYRDLVIGDPGNTSYMEYAQIYFRDPNVSPEVAMKDNGFRSSLESKKDYYRRYRDLSYMGMVGIYILQIVDAAVDAHFYNFDVGDDLSMQVEPAMMAPAPGEFAGVGLQLKFKF